MYRNLPNPMGVALYDDKVYWVDRNLRTIYRAPKDPSNDTKPEPIRSDMDTLRDIVIYHEKNQPLSKHFFYVIFKCN